MNLNRIVILIANDTRRGKLTGQKWKVLLNRLGLGRSYRRPKDINIFKAFLDNRQYAYGEHAENAVKFFFGIQGIKRVDDGRGGRILQADLARRLTSKQGYKKIGTVSLNLKNNQISYDVDASACEEDGLDYVELMARAVEDFERERVIRLDEVIAAAESILRYIGFNEGPEWFVAADEDSLKKLRELVRHVYEWGYDFGLDEIDLGDLKKTSGKPAEIERRAYDYVWNDIQRRAKHRKRIPVVNYRGVAFVIDRLTAEGKIKIRNRNITVSAGVSDAIG